MERKEMQTITMEGKEIPVIDSREVAEMLGKEHYELLKEIEGRKDSKNVGIIPTLEKGNFHLSNYFIPSTYKAGKREYKCYLCTKMGCELVGNKQQGEKGILFSAKYVERFNQYDEALKVESILKEKYGCREVTVCVLEGYYTRKELLKVLDNVMYYS